MKKILLSLSIFAISLGMVSCVEKGTMQHLNTSEDGLEVYKYYYDDGFFVYISRFKDQPNVQTSSWQEQQGKTTVTRGNVVIYENDSIVVMQKAPVVQ
jgi:hypothetical protein